MYLFILKNIEKLGAVQNPETQFRATLKLNVGQFLGFWDFDPVRTLNFRIFYHTQKII
jgi:hypothetical protein